MTGPRYSQAGLQALKAGSRIVPARQQLNLLAAVEGLPPAHRCPGLTRCGNHPRWRVVVRRGTPPGARSALYPLRLTTYHVFRPHATIAEAVLLDHAEAMDLATERAEQAAEGAGRADAEFIAARADLLIERGALAARLAAVEALARKWDDLPCVCGYVVPNGNDDRTQCLSCASVDLRAALAAPTDTTKETDR